MKDFDRSKKAISKDKTAVILEDIRSQFAVFGESLGSVSDKIDKLEVGQEVLNEKVDKLETRVDSIDTTLKTVDEKLIRIEDNVVEIKHKLSEKVDLEDFQKLEMRLIKLEKIVFQKI